MLKNRIVRMLMVMAVTMGLCVSVSAAKKKNNESHKDAPPPARESVELPPGLIESGDAVKLQKKLQEMIQKHNAALLKKYDKDKNGTLSAKEKAAMEKDRKNSERN